MANPNEEIKYTQIFINNRFVNALSGKTFNTMNPVTGNSLVALAAGDVADVDLAVEAALQAFQYGSPWRNMDASERGLLLSRLADLVQRDLNTMASLESIDSGRPFRDSVRDVKHCISTLRYYAGWADKIHGSTVPTDGDLLTYTRQEPIGVVGQITSWDYPIAIQAWKLGPAVAAGCTVVMKPSSRTSLTALHLAALTAEVGFPNGVYNIVTGDGPTVGQAIAAHPYIKHVSFTGTKEYAKSVMEAAAVSNLKKVSLHLGVNSPVIVLKDANVDEAVQIATHNEYANHIFVQEDIYDDFVKRAVEAAQARIVGSPFEKGVRQGPQINENIFKRVLNYIAVAQKQGAKLECGGNRVGDCGYFVETTVFSNVTDEMKQAMDEVYGPVQSIIKFRTLDEVVKTVNHSWHGLAAGLVTHNIDHALYLSRRLEAGTVWVNTWNTVAPQAPFGGYKRSGHGRTLGYEGIGQYLETKTVSIMEPSTPSHYCNGIAGA